jgi:hypothetical protein
MSQDVISAVVPLERPAPPAPVEAAATPPVVEESPVAAPAVPEEPKQPDAPPTEEVADESVVDYEGLLAEANAELATKGELSSEALQKLADSFGVPRDFINLTYQGMKAERSQRDSAVLEVAGGNDAYGEMIQWATKEYSADEAQAFNEALVKGTRDEALAAIKGLKNRFTAVNGSPKATIDAATKSPSASVSVSAPAPAAVPSVKPFGNLSELSAAQRDQRYGKDSDYTNEVYARARISSF